MLLKLTGFEATYSNTIMATVKVKFRKSTVPGRTGSIYYQVSHRGKMLRIPTSLRLHPEEWETSRRQLSVAGSDSFVQFRIESDLAVLNRIIQRFELAERDYDVGEIALQFRVPQHQTTILAFMRQQIDQLEASRRFGTARNYHRAMNSLAAYFNGEDLPFQALTEQVVEHYGASLEQRGVVRNSVSFYMRILRSVYNKAVRLHLVEQSYPFRHVYTGVDTTRKRAVDERIIARLFQLDLRHSVPLARARDLFIFSYCTRGMAFVDMAYLRKTNIRNGTICYTRHKTRQQLCVRIEPVVQRIIDKYECCSSVYVLPVLRAEDAAEAFAQYQTALNYYNRQLKVLSGLLELDYGLSSYTARHSWATAARNHNIPISVISAGMGHTSERTTQIYLSLLENSVIDTANRQLTSLFDGAAEP